MSIGNEQGDIYLCTEIILQIVFSLFLFFLIIWNVIQNGLMLPCVDLLEHYPVKYRDEWSTKYVSIWNDIHFVLNNRGPLRILFYDATSPTSPPYPVPFYFSYRYTIMHRSISKERCTSQKERYRRYKDSKLTSFVDIKTWLITAKSRVGSPQEEF